ncbi:MAG: GNAT family N-acetyltransferase [Marmoricola sp.]
MQTGPGPFSIRRRPLDHDDALALIERVQAEYVVRYGSPDESPIDPEHFEDPEGAFYVGYVDEVPVVTGGWRRHAVPPDVAAASVVEIKRMYVVPEARGRGLARRMLAHLEETAVAAGVAGMILETGIRQPEAIGLYVSAGYVPVRGFGHYAGSPYSRCFAKTLTSDRAHSAS